MIVLLTPFEVWLHHCISKSIKFKHFSCHFNDRMAIGLEMTAWNSQSVRSLWITQWDFRKKSLTIGAYHDPNCYSIQKYFKYYIYSSLVTHCLGNRTWIQNIQPVVIVSTHWPFLNRNYSFLELKYTMRETFFIIEIFRGTHWQGIQIVS